MAETTHGSGEPGTTAPAAAYIHLTPNMQAFYAGRGMWADGQPRGVLASMLGERCPWAGQYGAISFWVTPEQIQALRQDMATCTARHALSGHQVGQFMRRLREAETRAGLPRFAQRALSGQPAPQADTRASPQASAAVPFEPLVCPPAGTRARQAFEKHVLDCIREIVDFQQTSAYGA